MKPQTYRLDQLLQGFFISKQAEGCSNKTIADYRVGMGHFARWCDANSRDPVRVTPQDAKAFLAHLRTQPNGRGGLLAAKTVANAYTAMRCFFRWLGEEMGTANPMLSAAPPKVQPAIIAPLSRNEVDRVLAACQTTRQAHTVARRTFAMTRDTASRDKAIVLTLLDSGLRSGELCRLTLADLDMATGCITVKLGKGAKNRLAYLGKAGRRALWRYLSQRGELRQDAALFATREGRAFTADRLTKLFARLGERAGVARLHPHRLRHSFATEMLKNGANLFALQQLLGHSTLEMVHRYAVVAQVDLASAHEASSPADRWRL